MISKAPSVVQLASGSFVELTKRPDYDANVLEPLHKAEAAVAAQKAADEAKAAEEAERARVARVAAQKAAALVAPVYTSTATVGYVYSGNNYDWGQCTWYVAGRVSVPSSMGNATNWESGLLAAGWHYGVAPGAVGVSHAGWAGHVVYVESVVGGVVTISEMNYNGLGVRDTRIAAPGEFSYLLP